MTAGGAEVKLRAGKGSLVGPQDDDLVVDAVFKKMVAEVSKRQKVLSVKRLDGGLQQPDKGLGSTTDLGRVGATRRPLLPAQPAQLSAQDDHCWADVGRVHGSRSRDAAGHRCGGQRCVVQLRVR